MAMNSAEDYITRCLTDCPTGQEDLLMRALARHLIQKVGRNRAIALVRGENARLNPPPPIQDGPVLPEREDSPEFLAEVDRRLSEKNPEYLSESEIESWLDARYLDDAR
jgi:hypothetical protein